MVRLSRERGGDPDRPGKRHPTDALLWRMAREGEPSWEATSARGAGLARRVRGDRVEPARLADRRQRRRLGPDLPTPRVGAAHAEAHTGVHPFAKAYVHTGMIGLDGEKMSKSRGNLVFVSKLRARASTRTRCAWRYWPGTTAATGPGRTAATAAQERLARWREAVACDAGPEATDLVARIREAPGRRPRHPPRPRRCGHVGGGGAEHGGRDTAAPRVVRDAVDALLGVAP